MSWQSCVNWKEYKMISETNIRPITFEWTGGHAPECFVKGFKIATLHEWPSGKAKAIMFERGFNVWHDSVEDAKIILKKHSQNGIEVFN